MRKITKINSFVDAVLPIGEASVLNKLNTKPRRREEREGIAPPFLPRH
jgi:hypothetical protein